MNSDLQTTHTNTGAWHHPWLVDTPGVGATVAEFLGGHGRWTRAASA